MSYGCHTKFVWVEGYIPTSIDKYYQLTDNIINIRGLVVVKKLLILLVAAMFLVACGSDDEEVDIREEEATSINENMDAILATESLTDVWHIEDYIYDEEELDVDRLFRFTDEYIMDEENFESLNGYEKGLAMKTSAIITKTIKGKYEDDKELFEEDREEYRDILKNGDDLFMNGE